MADSTSDKISREENEEAGGFSKHQNNVAIHTATYDIDEAALGINIPKRYYLSPGFIGTVVVSVPVPNAAIDLTTTGTMLRKYKQLHGLRSSG